MNLRKGDTERKRNGGMNTVPHKEVYFFTLLKDMVTNSSDLAQFFFFFISRGIEDKSGSPIVKLFNKTFCVIFLQFLLLLIEEC